MHVTRRQLLASGSAATVAALAGCSGTLAGGGSAGASFRDWLYEPGTVADTDHYLALRYTPAALADRSGDFDDGVYDLLRAFGSDARDLVGLGFGGTDAQLVFGRNSVLVADFEASEVASTLQGNDFVSTGEYGEFAQFVGPDEDTAVGVGSDAAVVARSTGIFGGGVEAARILQAIVDVQTGDAESYAADSADFETLVDELGAGALASARTHAETDETDTDEGAFAGEVARGVNSTLVDDGVETTFALVFAESGDVDTGDLEDWTAASDTFDTFESVEVTTSGRAALVTGTEPTAEYDFYLESF